MVKVELQGGFCYLDLFKHMYRSEASALGESATVAGVRRIANAHADPLDEGRFSLSLGTDSDGVIGHVMKLPAGNNRGVTAAELIGACDKSLRLGGLEPCCLDLGIGVCGGGPPNDLPYNIPDAGKYPYARYSGLRVFVGLINPEARWEFLVVLGAVRDTTPNESFWTQAFATSKMLEAYFKLPVFYRSYFQQHVRWIRDPIAGRPGGVQIVPPDWPGVLPTPVHHVMTRYAGLREWVGGLSDNLQEMCRMSLFGIHEPFDPVWWEDYQKTVDMYTLYSRLSPEERLDFQQSVYWLPDAAAKGVSVVHSLSDVEGYCYLKLAADNSQFEVSSLGLNPSGLNVKAKMMQKGIGWSVRRFRVEEVFSTAEADEAYRQWHVVVDDDGMTVAEVLGLMCSGVRVGATTELNALMNLQGQDPVAAVPTVFPERPLGGGAGVELSFNVFAIIGKDDPKNPGVNFDIMREPSLLIMLGAYESVQLVSATFNLQLSPGSQNVAWAAICAPALGLKYPSDWYATPINVALRGSDQGWVSGALTLPDVHSFEKEIRAGSSVGNPYPTFRFSCSGAAGALLNVKGCFKVRCRGQFAMGHIKIGGNVTTSLQRNVASLRASLPQVHAGFTGYSEEPAAEDEEDSDDDVPAAPAVRSPPKAGMSAHKA